jgi:hypothetical protein
LSSPLVLSLKKTPKASEQDRENIIQARTEQGTRCHDSAPCGHWETVTVLSSVRLDVKKKQAELLFLPAYRPDINPIEKMWSKVKQILRGIKARTHEELPAGVKTALNLVSANDARGWFVSCGYTQLSCWLYYSRGNVSLCPLPPTKARSRRRW